MLFIRQTAPIDMGLNNRSANVKYVRLKDGKFYLSTDKENANPYSELEGTIVKAYYKNEEFEKTPIRKLILVVTDGEDNYQLSLNVESTSYNGLISFLANVDLSQPLTLHPKMETQVRDGKEVTKRTILVSQNGKFARSYFTKEDPKGLPAWKSVKVGNKVVTDKSEFLDFLENYATTKLFANLSGETTPKVAVAKEEAVAEEDTSLPWD